MLTTGAGSTGVGLGAATGLGVGSTTMLVGAAAGVGLGAAKGLGLTTGVGSTTLSVSTGCGGVGLDRLNLDQNWCNFSCEQPTSSLITGTGGLGGSAFASAVAGGISVLTGAIAVGTARVLLDQLERL